MTYFLYMIRVRLRFSLPAVESRLSRTKPQLLEVSILTFVSEHHHDAAQIELTALELVRSFKFTYR